MCLGSMNLIPQLQFREDMSKNNLEDLHLKYKVGIKSWFLKFKDNGSTRQKTIWTSKQQ